MSKPKLNRSRVSKTIINENICCTKLKKKRAPTIKNASQISQINKASVAFMRSWLEDWARATAWLRSERFDWCAEGISDMYRGGVANGIFKDPVTDVYQMYIDIWNVIDAFFKLGSKRNRTAINRWLDQTYDIPDYVAEYNLNNWSIKNQMFKEWLTNRAVPTPDRVSVPILSESPEWDPFTTDSVEAKEQIVPPILVKQELEFNEFDDSGEDDFRSPAPEPELNQTVSFPIVSAPPLKKRKLINSYVANEFKVTIPEEDLDSDREHGVFSGYVSLADQFVNYTSPPDYPKVKPTPVTPDARQTPLQNISYSFPSRTKDFKPNPHAKRNIKKRRYPPEPPTQRMTTLSILTEAEKILKSRKPEIKLLGGMNKYVPPHMRQVRGINAGRGWSNWCCRNIEHRVVNRGAGMIEHRYLINTPARIPLLPAVSDICRNISAWCYRHAIESTHRGGTVGGGLNVRMRALFHANANRGGAVRSTRAVGIRDVEALQELLEVMYQDDLSLYGSDPVSSDDDHFLQALHVLVPEHEDEGGCDWKSHQTVMGDYTIVSMKSKNNNCGVACLLYYTDVQKQQNTIRNEVGLPLNTPLTFRQMQKVAKHLNVGFKIWQEDAGVCREIKHYKKNVEGKTVVDILYNPILKHYSVLKFKNFKVKCLLCGKFIRNLVKHECDTGTISFYNKNRKTKKDKVAMFNGIKDDPRDLNNVYVFDLETFPEHNNIHTPYACMIQNVGTKQEWLKYGQGVEVMEDIYNISKTDEHCVFIAHNLARFDGSFLFNYLLSKGVKPEFVINGGRILSMKWFNSQVWDTYLFIADSLKNIAQTFKCKVQKGDFNHELIKTWQDVETFKDQSPTGMGWKPYLDCDVYSLREIVELYSTNVYKQFGADVFNYVTLSSMTYKLWGAETVTQHLPIETPQNDEYEFIKDSVFGGRVFPMQKEFATNAISKDQEKILKDLYAELESGSKLDDIKYDIDEIKKIYKQCWDSGSFIANMDMNSLYPTAMCMEYPVGIGEWSPNPKRDFDLGHIGIYYIKFKCPKNIIMAILPQRNKDYVGAWGKGDKKLNKQWKSSGIKWSLEDGEGVYTSIDIHDAISQGYQIEFQNRAYIWRNTAPVFKHYIETIYKIKKEQDLLVGTSEYNEIIRMIAKNMMNSLYGKTCQRPIKDEQRVVKTEREFYEFAKDFEVTDYIWVQLENEMGLALNGSPADVANTKPSHLGAFVLAYSRQIMMADFRRCTNNLADCNYSYTDTDSIHMSGTIYKQMLEIYPQRFGSELGQFSNDIKGAEPIIIYEHCLAPKCYMYVYITEDGKMGFKKKVKGIPKSVLHQIGMHDFVNENTIELKFDSLKKNMFNKKDAPFSIENTKASRTFLKNKWNKMLYSEPLKQFRPFGYDADILVMDEFLNNEEKSLSQVTTTAAEPPVEKGGYPLFATGIQDRWYGLQAPALGLNKERLVKWVCTPFSDNGKKEKHHFTRLNVPDMIDVLEKNKYQGAYLYEVVEDRCRLYCDIDKARGEDDITDPKQVLDEVLGTMKHIGMMFGAFIDPAQDLRILSSCTSSKISFHISSPKHIFKNPQDQKSYWQAVEKMFLNIPLLSDGQGKTVLDMSVYHRHRAFRTIFSKKVGKENTLRPIDIDCRPLYLNVNEMEEYFIVESIRTTKDISKLAVEMTNNVRRSSKGPMVLTTCHTSTTDLPYNVQTILEKNKEKLAGINLKVGKEMSEHKYELIRQAPGMCSICNRTHDKQAGFIHVAKTSYYRCWQDPDKTKLLLI